MRISFIITLIFFISIYLPSLPSIRLFIVLHVITHVFPLPPRALALALDDVLHIRLANFQRWNEYKHDENDSFVE